MMHAERAKLLSPTTFGIHYKLDRALRDVISRKFDHSTYVFQEYILEKPIPYFLKPDVAGERQGIAPFLARVVHNTGLVPALNLDVINELKAKSAKLTGNQLAARLYSVSATPENLLKFGGDIERISFQIDSGPVMKPLISQWLDTASEREVDTRSQLEKTLFQRITHLQHISDDSGISAFGGILKSNVFEQKKYIRQALGKPETDALALLREFELILRPLVGFDGARRGDAGVALIAVSISSNAFFWGECIVLLPLSGAHGEIAPNTPRGREKLEEKLDAIISVVATSVRETFLPTMTIFENYLCETSLKRGVKDERRVGEGKRSVLELMNADIQAVAKNCAILDKIGLGQDLDEIFDLGAKLKVDGVHGSLMSDNIFIWMLWRFLTEGYWKEWFCKANDLERSLMRLWAARLAHVAPFGAKPIAGLDPKEIVSLSELEESLVFEKYLVASPAMLSQVLKVVGFRHGNRGLSKPTVRSALVVGGPGSGKDSMAQLIRLFAPGYRMGPLVTLNMATFRPKEAAVPLLLGLNVHHEQTRESSDTKLAAAGPHSPSKVSLLGVLDRAWKLPSAKWNDDGSRIDGSSGKGLTLIFDELNSLDMDTQGALLRFLENGELLPLGEFDTPKKKVDALVIGVMNENPDTITKARTLDRVLRDKQVFGGMMGDILYEFFRRQRRLRDDLYFRMIRGGEIILPDLCDRREDIPVLFYFTVKKEFEPLMAPKDQRNWEIELSAYETLMDPSIRWEGNIRELQTVARQIFAVADADHEVRLRQWSGGGDRPRLNIRGVHARHALDNFARETRGSPSQLA